MGIELRTTGRVVERVRVLRVAWSFYQICFTQQKPALSFNIPNYLSRSRARFYAHSVACIRLTNIYPEKKCLGPANTFFPLVYKIAAIDIRQIKGDVFCSFSGSSFSFCQTSRTGLQASVLKKTHQFSLCFIATVSLRPPSRIQSLP